MSRVRPPQDEWARINALEQRVTNLERSNQLQSGGNAVVDSSGTVRMRIGPLPDGTFGTVVYAADGTTEEARFGQLNAGPDIYGLGVRPYGADGLQQVAGVLSDFQSATFLTTSTTWVAPTGVPTVTAEIGPSGKADCTIGAHIATGDVSQEGYVGLMVDGDGPYFTVGTSESVGAGGISSDVYGRFTMDGMTVGVHTFAVWVWTANNASHNVGFSNIALTVSPL